MSNSKVLKKYSEAEFFFNKMENHSFNKNEYEYYLSAFINAARNITFAMQKEWAKLKGFNNRYIWIQKKLKANENCVFFNSLRVYSIHEWDNKMNDPVGIHMRHQIESDWKWNCVIYKKDRSKKTIWEIKVDLSQFEEKNSKLSISWIPYEYLLEEWLIENRYYFDSIEGVSLDYIDIATINDLSYDYISFLKPFVLNYLHKFIN